MTGAAGFIGSNLVEAIIEMGYFVRGVDNFSNGKIENIEMLLTNEKFEFIEGDITDFDFTLRITNGINYVLHQAAYGSVPRSLKFPLIYMDNNVLGTSNMLEAARINGVDRFVYASSSSVYGDSNILPKRVGEEGNVISPYALTKKVNEEYAKLYTEVYGLHCIGLRYFNVFGPRQNPNSQYAAVIPKFIMKLMSNEDVEVYGDGNQSRDFTYIDNVIEANLKACVAPIEATGKAYNIAVGGRYTINHLFDKLKMYTKSDSIRVHSAPRQGDVLHSQADITMTKKNLGYDGKIIFEDGLKKTVDWYQRQEK